MRLGAAAGVSQSMISRAERGLAPSMTLGAIVRIGRVLGRAMPLGLCPHAHDCPWQEVVLPIFNKSHEERWISRVLGIDRDDVADDQFTRSEP
jgi:hypothetical protein